MHTHPAYLICALSPRLADDRRAGIGRGATPEDSMEPGAHVPMRLACDTYMLVTPRRETERAVSCSLASCLTPPLPLPRCQVIPDEMRRFTTSYRPKVTNLETKLKVFIPDFDPVRTRCACSPFRALLMEHRTPLPVDGLTSYHRHTRILSLLQQSHSTHARPVHRCA